MQKTLFLLLFCCLSANIAQAQTYEYDFTAILPLDEIQYGKEENRDTLMEMHTIRYAADDLYFHNQFTFFLAFRECASNTYHRYANKLQWYDDVALSRKIEDYEFPKGMDTIVTQNPTTKEEQIKVVCNSENFFTIKGYALRHKLVYDAAKNTAKTEIIAIAPIEPIQHDTTEKPYIRHKWAALPENHRLHDYNIKNPALHWVKFATLSIKNQAFTASNTSSESLQNHIYNKVKNRELTAFVSYNATLNDTLQNEDLYRIFHSQLDTIVTYAPNSYEESLKVVNVAFIPENISRLRFKMLYFFDEKNFKIGCKILAIGLEENKIYPQTNLQYLSIPFYIKPE
jgi:Gliding motility associated protein GldN